MKNKGLLWAAIIVLLTAAAVFIIIRGVSIARPQPPAATPKPALENSTPEVSADKFSEKAYAGRLTEIANDTITIICDETESFSYRLSERAARDLSSLGIEIGSRIIVNFEKAEDGSLTAASLEKITVE